MGPRMLPRTTSECHGIQGTVNGLDWDRRSCGKKPRALESSYEDRSWPKLGHWEAESAQQELWTYS